MCTRMGIELRTMCRVQAEGIGEHFGITMKENAPPTRVMCLTEP